MLTEDCQAAIERGGDGMYCDFTRTDLRSQLFGGGDFTGASRSRRDMRSAPREMYTCTETAPRGATDGAALLMMLCARRRRLH